MLRRKEKTRLDTKRLSKVRRIREPDMECIKPSILVQPHSSLSVADSIRVLKQGNWSSVLTKHIPKGPVELYLTRPHMELHTKYSNFIRDWAEILRTYPYKLDFSMKREALNQARRIFGSDFSDGGNHYVRCFKALLAASFYEARNDDGKLDLPYWGWDVSRIPGGIDNLGISYRYRKLFKRVVVFLGTPLQF